MKASEATQYYVHQAAAIMDLGERIERLLLAPQAEHHVSIPVELDNGELQVFSGYRIQHNSARGPMKGGLRYHPTVDPDDVRALASLMTWKTARREHSVRRRQGRHRLRSRQLSSGELERVTRKFVHAHPRVIGPHATSRRPT